MAEYKITKSEVNRRLEKTVGKTLGEIDTENVFGRVSDFAKVTGIAGIVIEQSVLGMPPDNEQKPDLDIDGEKTEVKTTGVRYPKRKKEDKNLEFKAKEPVTITAVSPHKIGEEKFEDSKFWHKLKHLLFVYYHYDSYEPVMACDYANFYIEGFEFFKFNEKDRLRLKHDWELVCDFIKDINENYEVPDNEYHRISSELRPELIYIDIAPKWPNKPRFRLKREVVNNIVQSYFKKKKENIPGDYIDYNDLDNKLAELSNKYRGKTIDELIENYNIIVKDTCKSISERIIVKMLGGSSRKLSDLKIFSELSLIAKTITLKENGKKKEDMKFSAIDFNEWADDGISFEDSLVYDYFANHQFIIILFQQSVSGDVGSNVFLGFKRIWFGENFLSKQVKPTWIQVRSLINNKEFRTWNVILDNKKDCIKTSKQQNNLPKSKNNIVFLKGTGVNSMDKNTILNGYKIYKHNVWVKGSYMAELLNGFPFL